MLQDQIRLQSTLCELSSASVLLHCSVSVTQQSYMHVSRILDIFQPESAKGRLICGLTYTQEYPVTGTGNTTMN